MELLTNAVNKVFDMLYLDYVFSSIMVIWGLIKFVLPNNILEWKMKLFSAGIAICMGVLFYFLGEYRITYLILSGLTIVTLYEWFVKYIFKALGLEYKAGDPELIKPKNDAK